MNDARVDPVEDFIRLVTSVYALVVFVEKFEVVQEPFQEAHGFAYNEDELVSDAGEGGAEVEQDDGRKAIDGRVFGSIGLLLLFGGTWEPRLAAVAEVSLMRALASMSVMLLRPCLPHMNPFCWESAQWVMAPEMV